MEKEKMMKEAYEMGKSDEYVSQLLCEQAQLYFDNDVKLPENITDEERDKLFDLITEAYIEGFYGTYKVDEVIKANLK